MDLLVLESLVVGEVELLPGTRLGVEVHAPSVNPGCEVAIGFESDLPSSCLLDVGGDMRDRRSQSQRFLFNSALELTPEFSQISP